MPRFCVDLIIIRPCERDYRSLYCDVIAVGPVTVFVAPCWWLKIGFSK